MAASVMIVLVYAVELACKYVAEEESPGGIGGHNTKQIYTMIEHSEQERIEERYREAVSKADRQMVGWDGSTKRDIQECIDEQRTIHLTLRKLGRMNIDWRYAAEQPGMFAIGIGPIGALVGWYESETFGANVAPDQGVVARILTGPHDANRQDPHLPMRYDTGRPEGGHPIKGSHSQGRPHSPARLGSGREGHLR